MMNMKKLFVGVFICMMLGLFYVHQQIVMVCLGYSMSDKKETLISLCDYQKRLKFEKAQLCDVARIRTVLKVANKNLDFAKETQIVRLPAESVSEPVVERAAVKSPLVSLASIFSIARVEAKPEDN